jgi:dihydrofolate reductase
MSPAARTGLRTMSKLWFDISISLDGYVAGPDPRPDAPLGDGGMGLHEWALKLRTWRDAHGEQGGETGPDDEIVAEAIARQGATIMGRGMFGGDGPWGEDPWNGWWGDEPPFGHPVFVLTHHAREPLHLGKTSFTFVTDGIGSALEQARAAAGDEDVHVAGGANIAQQYLSAGLLDEVELHVVPILLGGGVRLFENVPADAADLEIDRVVASPAVTHVRYRTIH